MVVMILENVPPSLRGELTRWLIEAHSGVFIGHVSARVRDKLWAKCVARRRDGGVIQAWTTNTEQHFEMRSWGLTDREVICAEGVWLARTPPASSRAADSPTASLSDLGCCSKQRRSGSRLLESE